MYSTKFTLEQKIAVNIYEPAALVISACHIRKQKGYLYAFV